MAGLVLLHAGLIAVDWTNRYDAWTNLPVHDNQLECTNWCDGWINLPAYPVDCTNWYDREINLPAHPLDYTNVYAGLTIWLGTPMSDVL